MVQLSISISRKLEFRILPEGYKQRAKYAIFSSSIDLFGR